MEILRREVRHLRTVRHPYIIEFEDVFEDAKHIHLITELCSGGELYDHVVNKSQSPEKHFSEEDAVHIIRNILDAISYCHDVHHIVHRDLKASNFLFLNPDTTTHIKIIDFGLSRYVPRRSCDGGPDCSTCSSNNKDDENDKQDTKNANAAACCGLGVMSSRVGTPYYVAPEVLTQESYTNKCDVWSIGVIAYLVLSGSLPFHAADERQTIKLLISDQQAEFPLEIWETISPQAQDFCRTLLQKDPNERPTARDAMRHEWIVHHCGDPPPLPPPSAIILNTNNGRCSLSPPRRAHKQVHFDVAPTTPRSRKRLFPRIFRKSKSSVV
jgi:calcium-dependent protein kinase